MGWPTRTAFPLARLSTIALGLLLLAPHAQAVEKCRLGRVAELPITMAGFSPIITAKINDKEARFVLDSGAFLSMMSAATAAEFNLRLRPAPDGWGFRGIGGFVDASVTTVKELTLAGKPIRNVDFLVGGSEVGSEGLIGQNFLEKWDVEYDFSRGVVRLFKPEGCKKALLAYWITPGQSYSQMEIQSVTEARLHTIGVGYVNGLKIRVMFDTGAYTSVLSLRAAARAGIKIDSPEVTEAGDISGIGSAMVKSYIATASSFKVGDDEEIKNARLRISDRDLPDTDMLLGSDFFVSHHVYVANSQQRLYVTYNGGPVFNLSNSSAATAPAAAAAAAADPAKYQVAGDHEVTEAAEQLDADALARRGEAHAARRDFEHALADLSKAIELRAEEPEYLYQRALVFRQNGQAALALTDLDRVLTLNQGFLRAYIPRAEIRLQEKNFEGAIADLDALDRLAPKQADLRFELAERYEAAGGYSRAMAQYDLWIRNHPVDSKKATALAARCWASAIQNEDLSGGLSDCNSALGITDKKNPNYGHLFVIRGMIDLRQANYDKAILDFDSALKTMPKDAVALYGRGVAKSQKNKDKSGQADIDAAETLVPKITHQYQRYGIAP
jgi:tetratricopeptide (TPR) repeat protein/predicted aspartyl protease